jgi:hypothetical protein
VKKWIATGTPFAAKYKSGSLTQESRVYDYIRTSGASGGVTAANVAAATGISVKNVAYYINELRKAGHVVAGGRTRSRFSGRRRSAYTPPPNAGNQSQQSAPPPPPPPPPPNYGSAYRPAPPPPASPRVRVDEANAAALVALEAALVAKRRTLTDAGAIAELNDGYEKYTKIKTLALNPGTAGEGNVAMKMALKKIIDLVF